MHLSSLQAHNLVSRQWFFLRGLVKPVTGGSPRVTHDDHGAPMELGFRAVIAAAFRTLRLYGVHLLAEVALPAGHDFGRDIP